MKKIRKTISYLLSGVVVALGFNSCGSQKQISQQISNAKQVLSEKQAEADFYRKQISEMRSKHAMYQERIKHLQEQRQSLIYGPPVPGRK